VQLEWSTVPGGRYALDTSTNLPVWSALTTNMLATSGTLSLTTNAGEALKLFRAHVE
jgi:hypothetical protein